MYKLPQQAPKIQKVAQKITCSNQEEGEEDTNSQSDTDSNCSSTNFTSDLAKGGNDSRDDTIVNSSFASCIIGKRVKMLVNYGIQTKKKPMPRSQRRQLELLKRTKERFKRLGFHYALNHSLVEKRIGNVGFVKYIPDHKRVLNKSRKYQTSRHLTSLRATNLWLTSQLHTTWTTPKLPDKVSFSRQKRNVSKQLQRAHQIWAFKEKKRKEMIEKKKSKCSVSSSLLSTRDLPAHDMSKQLGRDVLHVTEMIFPHHLTVVVKKSHLPGCNFNLN
jgi:hypothetical protein